MSCVIGGRLQSLMVLGLCLAAMKAVGQETEGLFDCSSDICFSGQTDLDVEEQICLGDDVPSLNLTPRPTPDQQGVVNDGWANEGLAYDSSASKFYTSRGFGGQTLTIARWSSSWNREKSEAIDYDSEIKHVGDIDLMGNYLVAPLSDYVVGGNLDIAHISWFDKGDLSHEGTLDLTHWIGGSHLAGDDDIAGVCVYNNHLYIVEYDTSPPTYIFELDLVGGVPVEANFRSAAVESDDANGIFIKDGIVLLSCGKGISTTGTIDVYRLGDLFQGPGTVQPEEVYSYCTAHLHAQGLTMRNQDLWVAQDTEVYRIDTPPFPALTPSPTPSATPSPSPSPTPSPTPSATLTPTPSPTLSMQAGQILNYLLGIASDPTGLDLNEDGIVDITDLVAQRNL